jgi:demethylspheroidene O-methyltransferase
MVSQTQLLDAGRRRPILSKSWRELWLACRNGLIGSARFQRWAAGFPLTRRIARRDARALFDLVAGFVYSQVLSACVALELFDILAEGPQPLALLAARLALTETAAERLLKAAAALDLTEPLSDGRYALGRLGAALRGNPSVAAMIAHHSMLYGDLADPVALLRGAAADSQLGHFWAYAKSADPAAASPERVRAYSALMAESQALVAGEILDAYPLDRHRRLLDIGGGEGVFLAEAAKRTPKLDLMLFDLPAVTERAELRFSASGLAGRAAVFGGSFFADSLPIGADVASLIRVLHDHDDEAALSIARAAHAALPKDGVLLVAEPMSGTRGAAPIGDAYFGFYLAAMGSGRPRTQHELSDLLRRAGFRGVQSLPTRTPLIVRLLVASV